ncbi:MAG TPA: phosphatidylinositol mannoside acyltransferase [Dermatophilaceae bacterium]|nr:phosphatidylinositol mannoside acyltransferase [Dermatophilaceae bacterium]
MSRLGAARDLATVTGYRLGWAAVRKLPAGAAYRMFDTIADLSVRRGGSGIDRLRANYARARPELSPSELDDLVRAGMRSYLRYFCNAFRLPDVSADELSRACRAVNDEQPRAHLARGQGIVACCAHLGDWDLAAGWSTSNLAPVTTVAERLKPEAVFREFLDFRQRLGMTILPLTGGGNPFTGLRAAVERGDFVALLADRDLTANGLEVELFGRPARVAKGPALLALLTGAPLYAASVHYEPAPEVSSHGGWRVVVTFSEQIPVPEGDTATRVAAMTQACVSYLQEAITRHTEDWHMLQRVFVEDLDPARLPGRS